MKITVIATKPNGTVILFRARDEADAQGYRAVCESRGWKVEVDRG